MSNNTILILIRFAIPLLFFFLMPYFGITGHYSFLAFIFILLIFHLLMPLPRKKHKELLSSEIIPEQEPPTQEETE